MLMLNLFYQTFSVCGCCLWGHIPNQVTGSSCKKLLLNLTLWQPMRSKSTAIKTAYTSELIMGICCYF